MPTFVHERPPPRLYCNTSWSPQQLEILTCSPSQRLTPLLRGYPPPHSPSTWENSTMCPLRIPTSSWWKTRCWWRARLAGDRTANSALSSYQAITPLSRLWFFSDHPTQATLPPFQHSHPRENIITSFNHTQRQCIITMNVVPLERLSQISSLWSSITPKIFCSRKHTQDTQQRQHFRLLNIYTRPTPPLERPNQAATQLHQLSLYQDPGLKNADCNRSYWKIPSHIEQG